jgi:predicted ATPase/DNA-binding SARP family transcriptional activator
MQISSSPRIRGLPVELTRFIGRERELNALRQLADTSRLLTITGAGGSGKSRLALELVAQLRTVPDGVSWIELAPITDAQLVPGAVLRMLDPAAEPGGVAVDRIVDMLHDTSALIILDNCEHLVEACATLADTLLRACPRLRIVATSREALGVQGERAWLAPPMDLDSDAVQLFVERARDVVSDFELTEQNAAAVAAICARLDGIPLAIELAAARVRVMSPEQIRERLSDAFALLTSSSRTALPRHRTLRAGIDWSHDLLTEDARAILRRLSVFRGGFTLDAAEAVASGDHTGDYATHDVAAGEVLDYVARLVDRSLLHMREHHDGARYYLLETVRQYAAQRLSEADEDEAAQRALAHCMTALMAGLQQEFTTNRRAAAVARLEPERDNFREVLHWTQVHDPALHVRLVGMLFWFWGACGDWMEARRWIDGALTLPAAAAPGHDRAALLFASGALAALQADVGLARGQLLESARLAADAGNAQLEAYALNYLGMSYGQTGAVEALEYSGRASVWFRENRDLYGLRLALLIMGAGEAASGNAARARELTTEAVAVARVFGQDRELGIALQMRAYLAFEDGDAATAEAMVVESLYGLRRDWSYLFLGRGLDALAVFTAARSAAEAARTLGAADGMRRHVGAQRFRVDQGRVDAVVPGLCRALGDAEFHRLHAHGREHAPEVLDEILASVQPTASAANGGLPPAAGRIADATVVPQSAPPATAPPDAGASAATTPSSASAADLRLRTLGSLQVWVHGRLVESWPYAKPKELLAYLVAHPRGCTRAEIAAAIWPDSTPAQARNTFHVTVHHLRKAVGHAEWITLEDERYRIPATVTIETDAAHFETEVRAMLTGSEPDTARLAAALALYTDHYMNGDIAGRWRDEEQDRLRRLYADAALRLGSLLQADGRDHEAVDLYESLIVHEPLLEEAHRRLIAYWTTAGDRVRAIRHFDRLAALLREELELEPDPETVELYERARSV